MKAAAVQLKTEAKKIGNNRQYLYNNLSSRSRRVLHNIDTYPACWDVFNDVSPWFWLISFISPSFSLCWGVRLGWSGGHAGRSGGPFWRHDRNQRHHGYVIVIVNAHDDPFTNSWSILQQTLLVASWLLNHSYSFSSSHLLWQLAYSPPPIPIPPFPLTSFRSFLWHPWGTRRRWPRGWASSLRYHTVPRHDAIRYTIIYRTLIESNHIQLLLYRRQYYHATMQYDTR